MHLLCSVLFRMGSQSVSHQNQRGIRTGLRCGSLRCCLTELSQKPPKQSTVCLDSPMLNRSWSGTEHDSALQRARPICGRIETRRFHTSTSAREWRPISDAPRHIWVQSSESLPTSTDRRRSGTTWAGRFRPGRRRSRRRAKPYELPPSCGTRAAFRHGRVHMRSLSGTPATVPVAASICVSNQVPAR